MAARILITMDDLETAVPLNAAFEAAGFTTAMFSSLDDAARHRPAREPRAGGPHRRGARAARRPARRPGPRRTRSRTLALLEPTDSERAERVGRLGVTETMMKPVAPDDAVATARRLIERRGLQERTGIIGESAPIQEVLVKIEQMAPVSSTVLIQGESGTGKELVAKAIHDLSPAARQAVRRGQLRRAARDAARERAVRPREGRLHRRGRAAAGPVRAGRRRDPLPRRDRRDPAGHPGEAAARAGEPRRSSGWAAPSRSRSTCASSPPPTGRSARRWRRASSATTCTTGSTSSTSTCRRCASGGRTSRSWCAGSSGSSPGQHDRTFRGITAEAMQRLVNAPWPGNVRELRNLIESMVVLAPGAEIRAADIPSDILEGPRTPAAGPDRPGDPGRAAARRARSSSSSSGACSSSSSRWRSSAAGWTSSPQRVQVIELGDHGDGGRRADRTSDRTTATSRWSTGPA